MRYYKKPFQNMSKKTTRLEEWWRPDQIELVKDLSRKWELKVFVSSPAVWHHLEQGKLLSKPEEGEALKDGNFLDPQAWDHEHCELCFETISDRGNYQSKGYTDGKEWVCKNCYETYILPFRET
jgi:hypothetical protein